MIKDPKIAEEVKDLMFKITNELNESLFKVRDCCPQDEFNAYRRVVGHIMSEMFDFLAPLFHEHPELKPKEWD
ncbi:hypothetical protein [Snodgrassella alvi]|jgi:hypothetical protein|uniref:Uncharacterized protein n=1 Tax=Snodgrassella alvi TaxID=1196083 RepID=A0A855G089_9NEIS|nr:hypothetical protein [Snodgrassella alvi]PIT08517.1 hypothetical protein BGI30_09670 [Snodgrassella alvi]PIT43261.1 hypothetical protein BHC51_11420 [Snodgrassella alvi]PIT57021.1 hypothetical protein BHC59_05795 [Snodgrassella alvi]PIT59543.1 hypothetical protein BHC57_08060 [Snodgrassella alvi]